MYVLNKRTSPKVEERQINGYGEGHRDKRENWQRIAEEEFRRAQGVCPGPKEMSESVEYLGESLSSPRPNPSL